MALDYSDTGHFDTLGKEIAILAALRLLWKYAWAINGSYPSGNAYFPSVLNDVYVNTAQIEDETEIESKRLLKENTVAALQDAHNQRLNDVNDFLMAYLAKAMDLDEGTIAEGPVTYEYDPDLLADTGQVSVTRTGGVLGSLKKYMVSANEHIRENGVTVGAVTARPGNRGTLAETTPGGGRSHALSGTLVLHCVDDTIGRTQLTCELVLTERLISGDEKIGADNFVTVGADYEDGPTGISLQMTYGAFVETGDGGNIISGFAWSPPSEDDSDKGIIYMRITRVSVSDTVNGIFEVEIFRGSNFDLEENLIGSRPIKSTSGTEVVSIPGRVSNFSFTFDRAAANTALPSVGNADSDIKFDLDVPRVGDEWTKTVTNDEAGVYSTKIAKLYRIALNTTANATPPSIPDTLAANLALTY